jgi:hypothetical protein
VTVAFFFLASIYVNAAVVDWWAGEAFGARRFLSCFPLIALGATVLMAASGGMGKAARVAVAAYPDDWSTLWIDRFLTPVKLLASLF